MPEPIAPAAPAAAPAAPAAKPLPNFSPNNFGQGLAHMRDAQQARAPGAPGDVDIDTGTTPDMQMARDDGPGFSRMSSIFDRPEAAPRQAPAPDAAEPGAQPLDDLQTDPAAAETPTERMLHGMKADDLLAALESGEIPQALYDKLRMKQKINGELRDVPLNEASENGMRLSDYSRAQNALKGERASFEQEVAQHGERTTAFNEMLGSWIDPKSASQTYDQLREMGIPHEVFELYAQDWALEAQLQKQNPAAYDRLMQTKAREREARQSLRKRDLESHTAQRDTQQQGTTKIQREAGDLLRQHMAPELEAAGIQDSPQARKTLGEYIKYMTDDLAKPLTREVLRSAVRATHEHLSDEARKTPGAQQRQAPRLGTQPVAPAAAPQAQQPQRVRISEMRDHMQTRRQ